MKRKVIQLAGKTLVVSLPSRWARRVGIKKGDEVDVDDKDSRLIISAASHPSAERAVFDARGLEPRMLSWGLGALNKRGFDEIEVLFEDAETVRLVHDLVRSLFIGSAITEQSGSRLIIRSVSTEVPGEADSALRRAFMVTLSLGDSLVEYLKAGRYAELEGLLHLEQTNNQLVNFCERILVKYGHSEYRKTCFAYIVAWNLEKVCDCLAAIAKSLSGLAESRQVSGQFISLAQESNALLRAYYEALYMPGADRVKVVPELAARKSEIYRGAQHFLQKCQRHESASVALLMEQLDLVSNFSAAFIALSV
ncbi:AbrB/MazE/SpoVT family DNA-binding domain-containing protein [Candidatus Woesearchaeota archaeon]|nr:AbrB/MazE/SpoVT family DNA-binding domain-containing protein [Candidatus Woesearchaeota archaeon]